PRYGTHIGPTSFAVPGSGNLSSAARQTPRGPVIWVVSRHGHLAIMQQSPCGDCQPGRRPSLSSVTRSRRISRFFRADDMSGYRAWAAKNCHDASEASNPWLAGPTAWTGRISGAPGQVWPPPSTRMKTTDVPAAQPADATRCVDKPSPAFGSVSSVGAPQPSMSLQRCAMAVAATTSLTPPLPVIVPPSNGTIGSSVPCVSITETGRDGLHGTATPRVPATGAIAANRSARSHASRLAMNAPADKPVAYT